ncbi:hypothetical protein [Gluconobacter kanchanaburiensis]|uniref:Uncharacterized protein n=1 Tax=Gluconobacter kanchanaburiensis NBRC 103587 TaxID=1307948 RepID=A0A511B774_9PROT|nr:hypothetical protein [Gluconobacter kanchanaburiensis]GBR68916.1 hypothetical protein AA103587_1054 [Gluconobacter kanchanaburiensis NBRC 103587]GEK96286.1 hypothetical protein GKA01_14830 [Gluconobacter kanchanaburiensis NBRC 103587]
MQQTMIAARLSRGYARAATVLGASGEQYRPSGGVLPMETLHAQPTLAFDVDAEFSFTQPIGWGIPTEYVLTDRRDDTEVGDILVASGRTYFVASVEPLRPPLCVVCSRTVSVSGVTGTVQTLVSECPAGIIMRAKGESSGSGVPGATRPGQSVIYLPLLPGVVLTPYMTVTTDLGTTYTINAVEISEFGIRCTMSLQQV